VYSKTVNLPQTKFDMRANSVVREPQLQQFWQDNKIYEQLSRENPGVRLPGSECMQSSAAWPGCCLRSCPNASHPACPTSTMLGTHLHCRPPFATAAANG
jgi:hypothetical protein